MVSSSREDLPTKQEGNTIVDDRAATNSRLWPGLTNPRIVRVSRAFGGKDRHSKVSTIRGLRDRRVRLSVPTAIQLYDLQDRLGLNQPSKVVDWLLNAAQDEIDKLPPLQIQPGNFLHFSQSLNVDLRESTPPQSSSVIKNSTEHTNEHDLEAMPRYTYWNSDTSQRDSPREAQREVGNGQNFQANQSFFSGLLNNAMPYSSYHQSETSNPYASHIGIHQSPGSQLGLCPSGPSMSQMFPPYMTAPTNSMDARQFGQYQMATLASQDLLSHPVRTYLHSDMDPKHHNSHDSHES